MRTHSVMNPEPLVGNLRRCPTPTDAQKEANKATSTRNKAAKKRIEADVIAISGVRLKEDKALALKHGVGVDREAFGAAPDDESQVRKPNVGNGLVKSAFQAINEREPLAMPL